MVLIKAGTDPAVYLVIAMTLPVGTQGEVPRNRV